MSAEATPETIARIANALYGVRQLLEWGGHLRAPDARGKKPKPIVKVASDVLGPLQGINEELRAALAMLGEEPGWSASHADAVVLKHRGYKEAEKFGAPPALAPEEAMDRIAQLEAELKKVQDDLRNARTCPPRISLVPLVPRSDLVAAEARALAAEGQAEEARSVDDALDEAASITGSGDPWRELSRFSEFCLRITFAGTITIPPGMAQAGQTVGPLVADDKDLPVYPWVRAEGRGVPDTIADAARLYVEWQREACAIFTKRLFG